MINMLKLIGRLTVKKRLLTMISAMIGMVIGVVIGAELVAKIISESENSMKELSEKHLALFLLMSQWVKRKQEGKNLSAYFEKRGLKRIAIYGMSFAGETLVRELKDTETKVVYGIDRNVDDIYTSLEMVSINDKLKPVDAIVVTAITYFTEIQEQLESKVACPIISLEDVVCER